MVDKEDGTIVETSLREMEEELGIPPGDLTLRYPVQTYSAQLYLWLTAFTDTFTNMIYSMTKIDHVTTTMTDWLTGCWLLGSLEKTEVLGVLRCNWDEVSNMTGIAVTPVIGFIGDLEVGDTHVWLGRTIFDWVIGLIIG